jgi:hypothetical protein
LPRDRKQKASRRLRALRAGVREPSRHRQALQARVRAPSRHLQALQARVREPSRHLQARVRQTNHHPKMRTPATWRRGDWRTRPVH